MSDLNNGVQWKSPFHCYNVKPDDSVDRCQDAGGENQAAVAAIGMQRDGLTISDIRIYPVSQIRDDEIIAQLVATFDRRIQGDQPQGAAMGPQMTTRSIPLFIKINPGSGQLIECASLMNGNMESIKPEKICELTTSGYFYYDSVKKTCRSKFSEPEPFAQSGPTVECPKDYVRLPPLLHTLNQLKKYQETGDEQILTAKYDPCNAAVAGSNPFQDSYKGPERRYSDGSVRQGGTPPYTASPNDTNGCNCSYATDMVGVSKMECQVLCVKQTTL